MEQMFKVTHLFFAIQIKVHLFFKFCPLFSARLCHTLSNQPSQHPSSHFTFTTWGIRKRFLLWFMLSLMHEPHESISLFSHNVACLHNYHPACKGCSNIRKFFRWKCILKYIYLLVEIGKNFVPMCKILSLLNTIKPWKFSLSWVVWR